MSQDTRPISRSKAQSVTLLPCDGVPRFKVKKEYGLCSYSEAYDNIVVQTRGYKDEKGGYVHSRESLRRIAKLNTLYLAQARPFIIRTLWQKRVDAVQKAAAEAKKDQESLAQPDLAQPDLAQPDLAQPLSSDQPQPEKTSP